MGPEFELNLRSYTAAAESHTHAHHQAIFPLRGTMDLETELGGHYLRPDSVAVMTAGEVHAFAGRSDNLFLIVDTAPAPATALNALWDAASGSDVFTLDETVCQLTRFAAMQPQVLRRSGRARESLALLLMQGLATQLGSLDSSEPRNLVLARRFIGENLAASIGLAEIAAAAGCSVSKLARSFQRWHGMSPGRYLAKARLRRAETLITDSPLPLAQIAMACGFSEQSAMTRAMTRAGMATPARLRQGARAARQATCEKPS